MRSGQVVGGVESVLPFPFPLSSFAFARLDHRGSNFNVGMGIEKKTKKGLTYSETKFGSAAPAYLATH